MERELRVLGLDLGTNSVGHALIVKKYKDDEALPYDYKILDANSRIIPPRSAAKDPLADYMKGAKQKSTASERRGFRSMRRRYARFILRRERLFRVLHELGWLPAHMENALDFDKHLGRFKIQLDKTLKSAPSDPTVEAPKMQWDGNDFVFEKAFEEMLADFNLPKGKLISRDWTIYYLRDKALREELSREELAYVITAFNAKRGYYQRGRDAEEEQEDNSKDIYTVEPKIVEKRDLTDADELPKGTKDKNAVIVLDCPSKNNDKNGKKRTLCFYYDKFNDRTFRDKNVGDTIQNVVVEEPLDEDENLTSQPRCKIDAWLFKKTRAAEHLSSSGKTLGQTIYAMLKESVQGGDFRIVGGIFGTIERKFYRDELNKILKAQSQWHPELTDRDSLEKIAESLYPKNEDHRKKRTGKNKTLIDFIVEDVIFYQRPLKTKKTLIDKCSRESTDKHKRPCAAVSNPYAQEFRVLQFILNLKIIDKRYNEDQTALFLSSPEQYQKLYDTLIGKDKLTLGPKFNKELVKIAKMLSHGNEFFFDDQIDEVAKHMSTNFDDMKVVKLNETHHRLTKHFKKLGIDNPLDKNLEYALWHLCYSVSDPDELEKGLKTFATKHLKHLADKVNPEQFAEEFKNIEPFEDGYSAFSEKALKKLLPLMRPNFVWDEVPSSAQKRIDAYIKYRDDAADEKAREERNDLTRYLKSQGRASVVKPENFWGLQPWLAERLVYGAQTADKGVKWTSADDIRRFISNDKKRGFRAGSLRNPIVEAVAIESLRVVADMVTKYGKPDEIHIELGRELNATAEQRKKQKTKIDANEKARQHAEEECKKYIREHKSSEKLAKLVERYLLWEEQDKRDPYVADDREISLSDALNGEKYQIDH
ncbi:MAG: hypothetical protein K6B46_05965, partial [Opitutales bacterium]|nr:hypothetical protein [Opitutales bacterium]